MVLFIWKILERYQIQVSDKVATLYWNVYKWPERILMEHAAAMSRLETCKDDILDKIAQDKTLLYEKTVELNGHVEMLRNTYNPSETENMVSKVDEIQKEFENAIVISETVQVREGLIGLEKSSFDLLVILVLIV